MAPRVAILLAAALIGCASPVGVRPVDPNEVQRRLAGSALVEDRPSVDSRQVLRRLGLSRAFREDPATALAALHDRALSEPALDLLFALAELSFLHARRGGGRDHFVACTVYAFAFLFPEEGLAPAHPLDPRLRTSADLYNRALARAMVDESGELVLEPGEYRFHLGVLELELDKSGLRWGDRRLEGFVSAADLGVRGLRNRWRHPGLGAPFVARTVADPGPAPKATGLLLADDVRVPVTFVMRYADVAAGLRSGRVHGRLSVYAESLSPETEIAGRSVPLEFETTLALASALEGSWLWSFGREGFLRGDLLQRAGLSMSDGDGLFSLRPHVPGRIPVVLVHGTASSPARWAELLNDLLNDPTLASRYEFWLFIYSTGNPVLYSASLLRQALRSAVANLDPEGRDPALQRMVLVGHSQGGLLVRLQAVTSGTRFWDAISPIPFDEIELEPGSRELLGQALFFEPQPFVDDVVFIATPHRGSFVAANWLGRLGASLARAPENLASLGRDMFDATRDGIDRVQGDQESIVLRRLGRVPNSVENMRPDSIFIQTLAEVPLDPRIRAHSIIPVRGGPPPEGQDDGVVAFESAHLEEAVSEKVVFRSEHSTQSDARTIQEVRRILLDALEGPPSPP